MYVCMYTYTHFRIRNNNYSVNWSTQVRKTLDEDAARAEHSNHRVEVICSWEAVSIPLATHGNQSTF